MRKTKYFIILVLLFICIGYATISVSLSINGNATVASDIEDFKVYFSDVLVNDVQSLNLVKSDGELVFDANLNLLGDTYKISYDVTNGSKLFDASVSLTCTQGTEYVSVVNVFDTSTPLTARSTRTGTLTLKKIQTNANEYGVLTHIVCSIVATPISRNSEGSGTVIGPLLAYEYSVGKEITIGDEKFNVISSTEDTVTMLAQYNLDRDYEQSSSQSNLSFDVSTSSFSSYPEVNIHDETDVVNNYVDNYVSYLKTITGDEFITGDLISLVQLKKLGCNVPDDYYYEYVDEMDGGSNPYNCIDSDNAYFLDNGQNWWTKSINSGSQQEIWLVDSAGDVSGWYHIASAGGIRPVITISKEVLSKTIIQFEIDGGIFYGYEGMTWREWVENSVFSSSMFYEDDYNVWYDSFVIVDELYNWVSPSEEILENSVYLTTEFCCFDAGSQVLMADGTTKNIEDVQIGDLVMSLNEDTGEFITQKVTGTIINPKSVDLVYVYLSNGTRIGMRAYHPLLTTEGWKSLRPDSPDARRENIEGLSLLEVGDTLVGYGEDVTIVAIEQREEVENYKTYNLSVEGYHNYVVEGIVAHNVSCMQPM